MPSIRHAGHQKPIFSRLASCHSKMPMICPFENDRDPVGKIHNLIQVFGGQQDADPLRTLF